MKDSKLVTRQVILCSKNSIFMPEYFSDATFSSCSLSRPIVFVLASKSKEKLLTLERTLSRALNHQYKIITVEVDSGVSVQPMTSVACFAGARNRALAALNAEPSADFAVGMEGGVEYVPVGDGTLAMESGWIYVVDRNGRQGVGTGPRFLLPERIERELSSGRELRPVMQQLVKEHGPCENPPTNTIGMLTGGLMDRVDAYSDGTMLALAPWLGYSELYPMKKNE